MVSADCIEVGSSFYHRGTEMGKGLENGFTQHIDLPSVWSGWSEGHHLLDTESSNCSDSCGEWGSSDPTCTRSLFPESLCWKMNEAALWKHLKILLHSMQHAKTRTTMMIMMIMTRHHHNWSECWRVGVTDEVRTSEFGVTVISFHTENRNLYLDWVRSIF